MKKPIGYELLKLKFLKGGGLSVTFEEETKDGRITNKDKHNIESPIDPHSDLDKTVDKLKGFVADVFGLRSFRILSPVAKELTAKQQEATKTLKSAFDKLDTDIQRRITINSIEFKGQEDSAGIEISATLTNNGYSQSVKTPVLKYTGDTWGFEEHISGITDEIEEEVEAYLFESKFAEPDLFGENNGKSSDKEPSKENLNVVKDTKKTEESSDTDEEVEELKVAM